MFWKSTICIAILSLSLTGCETFEGSQKVMGEGGHPVTPRNPYWPVASGQTPAVLSLAKAWFATEDIPPNWPDRPRPRKENPAAPARGPFAQCHLMDDTLGGV